MDAIPVPRTVLCDQAPAGQPVFVVPGDGCPYCGEPISSHDLDDADTKTMRRIETEAGNIVGTVDRALRKVVWHLECPDCTNLIPFTEDTFAGRGPVICECGWKTRPTSLKTRSEEGGIHAYYNYADLAFDDGSTGSGAEGKIHQGMSL